MRHPTLPLMYQSTFFGTLFEVSIDPGLSLREIPITGVKGLAVSPDGTRLYAGERKATRHPRVEPGDVGARAEPDDERG